MQGLDKFSIRSAEKFLTLTGYQFQNAQLLGDALTHSSHRSGAAKSYERLEFLGDRVLGMVIAEWLYADQPDADEGRMARQFTFLVRKGTCTQIAKEIGLPQLLRAGRSADGKQVAANSRMLGDACEAVLAAIYLDSGLQAVKDFILQHWKSHFEKARAAPRDPKSRLQEWALAKGLEIPTYTAISREGPDHQPQFVIEVSLSGYDPATGQASSKRRGEQIAAENFIAEHRIKQK